MEGAVYTVTKNVTRGYYIVPESILRNVELKEHEKIIAIILFNEDSSYEYLSEVAKCTIAQVKNAITKLNVLGIVETEVQ